ncbi:hypothetical protein JCM5296_006363 [Sporobolomyces johnsonii]
MPPAPAPLPPPLKQSKPKSKQSASGNDDTCPVCTKLEQQPTKDSSRAATVWVECDKCETWYHWSCVAPNPVDTPDSIDKWYCPPCLSASSLTPTPLQISYKPPSRRKSSRSTRTQHLDYANLNEHLPASADRWSKVIAAREESGQIRPDGFRRMKPDEVTDEWVYGENGMLEPFVVEEPEGLGMRMPRRDIPVKEIAELVGPKTPLEVIDCASQSSLSNWTLGQWAEYYDDPQRDKVRNVISLEVSETRLGQLVQAPELVRKLDWVDNVWPNDMKQPGTYPRVQKYCLMSVERCWTDWHVDFAGSSVFYHILRGGKTFYFIRPTPANLAAYERWSGSTERQEQTWLGDMVDAVWKIELKPGNTAFLPTGWIHAVYTPADSIVIGGNFLHSLNIPTQLRIYEIELATKVPKKFRYPHFVKLLWLVANHYQSLLTAHQLPPTPDRPLPITVNARVLNGLKALSSFLIQQTTRFAKGAAVSAERRRVARENVPWAKVSDPVKLSREFRKTVLRALGDELDAECFLPHVAHVEEPAEAGGPPGVGGANGTKRSGSVGVGSSAGGKRKADSQEPPEGAHHAATKAKIKHATNGGSPAPPPAAAAAGAGEIVSRQTAPVVAATRQEERFDPKRPELGPKLAEVKESRSTQMVVRRWEDEGGEKGAVVVETRTVLTVVERVRWPAPSTSSAPANSQPPPQPTQQRPHASYSPYVMNGYPAPQPQSPASGSGSGTNGSHPSHPSHAPPPPHPHSSSAYPYPYGHYGYPYPYYAPPPSANGVGAPPHYPPHVQGWPPAPPPHAHHPHPQVYARHPYPQQTAPIPIPSPQLAAGGVDGASSSPASTASPATSTTAALAPVPAPPPSSTPAPALAPTSSLARPAPSAPSALPPPPFSSMAGSMSLFRQIEASLPPPAPAASASTPPSSSAALPVPLTSPAPTKPTTVPQKQEKAEALKDVKMEVVDLIEPTVSGGSAAATNGVKVEAEDEVAKGGGGA